MACEHNFIVSAWEYTSNVDNVLETKSAAEMICTKCLIDADTESLFGRTEFKIPKS